jgi:hypothetical protein
MGSRKREPSGAAHNCDASDLDVTCSRPQVEGTQGQEEFELGNPSSRGSMTPHRHVYVFVSGDCRTFGLSFDRDGASLPPTASGWQRYDEIPLCLGYLSRYAEEPATARANLSACGYHLAPTIGRIVGCKVRHCSTLAQAA